MKTPTKLFLGSSAVLLLMCAMTFRNVSSGHVAASPPLDTAFIAAAADAGMLEIQLGKLATAQGSSAEIKKFGESMVADHTKANEELKAIVAEKGQQVPNSLSPKSQKKYEAISGKTGMDFDKSYARQMVTDHQEVIAKFEKESNSGEDKDVRAWAKSKIPTLQHHLMMAEDMTKKVVAKH